MPKTVLLITNRLPTDSGGRAEKIGTRKRLLERYGWDVALAHAPEPYVSGFLQALVRCVRTGRHQDVDAVASINNPFHLHILGYLVSSALNKPWLAELRDPIASHPDRNPYSPVTWGAKAVERLVVYNADRVVWFDGIQLSDDYFDRYGVPDDRIVQLPPMGYEKEKFNAVEATEYEEYTITYAGSFYDGWIEPYASIDGIKEYADRIDDENFRVQFYGDWTKSHQLAVQQAGIPDLVDTYDFVPHDEIVSVLKGSDALLYIGGNNPGNKLNIPSKIWDYVGASRPILAVVDPSFRVADFLRNHDLGIVANPKDPNDIANAIETLRNNYQYTPDSRVFEIYTRERSAARISDILDDITNT